MNKDQTVAMNILREDGYTIPYRPELARELGSVTAALLLQRIICCTDSKQDRVEKFYKFKEPCSHEKYKPGDSWVEELGWSSKIVTSAFDKFGFKLGTATRKAIAKELGEAPDSNTVKLEFETRKAAALVVCYTDQERLTWYSVNWESLSNFLIRSYQRPVPVAITGNSDTKEETQ